jgi:hypothetical protein
VALDPHFRWGVANRQETWCKLKKRVFLLFTQEQNRAAKQGSKTGQQNRAAKQAAQKLPFFVYI